MAVAVVMATSMVTSASAAISVPSKTSTFSWTLTTSTPPRMPSGTQAYTTFTKTYENNCGTALSYFTSICTSFSSVENEDGNIAYATYRCKIVDLDGNKLSITSWKNHRQKSNPSTGTKTKLGTTFKYGRYAVLEYKIKQPSDDYLTANMGGTYKFTVS